MTITITGTHLLFATIVTALFWAARKLWRRLANPLAIGGFAYGRPSSGQPVRVNYTRVISACWVPPAAMGITELEERWLVLDMEDGMQVRLPYSAKAQRLWDELEAIYLNAKRRGEFARDPYKASA